MLPPKIPALTPDQQKLVRLYRKLNAEDRATLLSFAAFLGQRAGRETASLTATPPTAEPERIPRPAEETVIAAIRRLTATYPMVDRDVLLHETADLMSAHVLQARAADDVIDELEAVFRRHYERVNSGR